MSIIPGLVSDVNLIIACFLGNDSQVALSGVNKRAYTLLSNGVHFKRLFEIQHPCLLEKLFKPETSDKPCSGKWLKTFITDYPESCWKVASCVFQRDRLTISNSFLETAPKFEHLVQAEKKKQAIKMELRELCGSSYADSNSPIHQAWNFCGAHSNEYLCLEERRILLQDSLLELSLTKLRQESILAGYRFTLGKEFGAAIRFEEAALHLGSLFQCLELIVAIRAGAEKSTPEILGKIHDLINSCSDRVKTKIWNDLYVKCAHGIQEWEWSEKHFHEHLRVLSGVIANLYRGHQSILVNELVN